MLLLIFLSKLNSIMTRLLQGSHVTSLEDLLHFHHEQSYRTDRQGDYTGNPKSNWTKEEKGYS